MKCFCNNNFEIILVTITDPNYGQGHQGHHNDQLTKVNKLF